MSKLFARLGGKKDKHSSQAHGRSTPSPGSATSNGVSGSPSSPGIARRASRQLLNFSLSSPSSGGERPAPARGVSERSTPSAAPKIELDFGDGNTSTGASAGATLQSTGVGLQSPIDGLFDSSVSAGGIAVNGNGQASKVIGKAEVEVLRGIRYTWTQVEKAWAIAGEELKVIGMCLLLLFICQWKFTRSPWNRSENAGSLSKSCRTGLEDTSKHRRSQQTPRHLYDLNIPIANDYSPFLPLFVGLLSTRLIHPANGRMVRERLQDHHRLGQGSACTRSVSQDSHSTSRKRSIQIDIFRKRGYDPSGMVQTL